MNNNPFSPYEQMGKDWLDGKITIKEFNGLKLNPKQVLYLNSKARALLACGGMACLHGDTKILNADTLEEIAIKNIKAPFRVFSWNGNKVVKAYASVPIKFKKEHLYTVKTSKNSFVATANHQVLTPQGYVRVSDLEPGSRLVASSPDLLGNVSVSYLSMLLSSVLYYSQRLVSSLAYYQGYLHLYGQRLLSYLNISPRLSPSPIYVPSFSLRDFYRDDLERSQANTYLSQDTYPPSSLDFLPQLFHQLSNGVDYNEELTFERISFSFLKVWRFVCNSILFLRKVLKFPHSVSSLDDTTIEEFEQVLYHSFDHFYDFHVFGTNNYLSQGVFHHNSGKTLAFVIKVILLSQFFPGVPILIGRKTQGNAEDTFMKDFMQICPPEMYQHQKGAHKILFSNGSTVEFWGLDALQSGASTDIKKAEQKLKSHNFGFEFVDQLEEIEQKVYDGLQSRMRWRSCSHDAQNMVVHRDPDNNPLYEVCTVCGKYTFNQFCATMNPANHWSYDWFKVNPRPNTALIETSTLDNKAHLTEQFIQGELAKPEAYKLKYFYGQWDDKSMVEGGVFAEEYILNQRALIKPPIRTSGGIRIFEEPQPNEEYQIGVDPSLGASDPCNITCISKRTGHVVATYTAYVPTKVIAEKSVQLALMYSLKSPPLIVPEATGVGQALVEALKPLWENIYVREVYAAIQDKKSSKLGFYTTHATKTQLIENMKTLFSQGFPKIYDEDTVNELNKFIYTDSALEKGAGAQQGYHDDRVMGLLLAYWNVPPTGYVDPRFIVSEEQQERFAMNRNRMKQNSSK